MKKIAKVLASFAALAFVVAPAVPASAYEADAVVDGAVKVSTYADFEQAIGDATVSTIKLDGNIDAPGKISILRDVTIDGGGHTIKFNGDIDWKSNFLQVYKATATVKDLTVKDGNLAFFVNGGTLNLEGTINMSGNFGGIGISQGENVIAVPAVNFADGVKVTYADEGRETPKGAPAPAIYSEADSFELKFDGINAAVYNVADSQDFLYFDASKAPEVSADGAFTALDVDDYRVTPIADTEKPTDPETPDVTEPVDEGKDTEADVTAPNTGATIANIALVVTGAVVAILTAVYATRFASARK